MKLNNSIIKKGFIISGLMNFTVLPFSKFFTNPVIPEFDSIVMSNFGLLMILIWGLAYMSISSNFHRVKWLIGIFAVEKFIYGFNWINWHSNNSIADVYDKDLLAGIFYSIYGINDWIFFLFFLIVFLRLLRLKDNS